MKREEVLTQASAHRNQDTVRLSDMTGTQTALRHRHPAQAARRGRDRSDAGGKRFWG